MLPARAHSSSGTRADLSEGVGTAPREKSSALPRGKLGRDRTAKDLSLPEASW